MSLSPEQQQPLSQENILYQTRGESLAQVHEALDTFLADIQFDTGKHAAFSDFVEYRNLELGKFGLERSVLVSRQQIRKEGLTESNEANLLAHEGELRETEISLAMLDVHIRVEKGRTPGSGYALAHEKIALFRERLERAYFSASNKNPADKAHVDLKERRDAILYQTEQDLW